MDKERNVRVRDSECTCYLGESMAAHLLDEPKQNLQKTKREVACVRGLYESL